MTTLFLFNSTKANHMSKINSGILGPYSGTIGSVTGYRRKGKNIIQGKVKGRDLGKEYEFNYNAETVHQLSKWIEFTYKGIQKIELEYQCTFNKNPNHLLKYMKEAYRPDAPSSYQALIINPERIPISFSIIKQPVFNPIDTYCDVVGLLKGWSKGYWNRFNAFVYRSNGLIWNPAAPSAIQNSIRIRSQLAGVTNRNYKLTGIRLYNDTDPTKQVIFFTSLVNNPPV